MPNTQKLDEVDGDITAMFHKKVKLLSLMRSSIEMSSSCSVLDNSLSHSFTSSDSFKSLSEDETPIKVDKNQPSKLPLPSLLEAIS